MVAGVGRTLITAGVLILLFVGYELWGTGVITARAQDDLRSEFEDLLASAPSTTSTTATTAPPTTAPPGASTTVPPPTTAPPVPAVAAPPVRPLGSALARIQIPSIGVDWIVVEGVDLGSLSRAPGHYPGTPMPGQQGNVAIAGHRTTHGAPFYRVNELSAGDEIYLTSVQGRFRYVVSGTSVVSPNEWSVVGATSDARLTLTSCNPRYSARERIVVHARLAGTALPAPAPAPASTTTTATTAPPTTALPGEGETVPAAGTTPGTGHLVTRVFLDDDGGDPDAVRPSILLALACAVVWLGFWVLGRLWRRWPAYLLGTPVFLAVLFVFFTQFSRLLPASY